VLGSYIGYRTFRRQTNSLSVTPRTGQLMNWTIHD